ncbi:hypothetical protein D3C81_1366520 [compost metagenome]
MARVDDNVADSRPAFLDHHGGHSHRLSRLINGGKRLGLRHGLEDRQIPGPPFLRKSFHPQEIIHPRLLRLCGQSNFCFANLVSCGALKHLLDGGCQQQTIHRNFVTGRSKEPLQFFGRGVADMKTRWKSTLPVKTLNSLQPLALRKRPRRQHAVRPRRNTAVGPQPPGAK